VPNSAMKYHMKPIKRNQKKLSVSMKHLARATLY